MATGEGWDVPDDVKAWSDFHWWKVPVAKILVLHILSDTPVWYAGHYYKGRMLPCYGEGCALCADGVGAQLRYLIVGADPVSRRVGILEVGRTIALEIRDISGGKRPLRGMTIELSRHSHSKQSRMEAKYIDIDTPDWVLRLEAPDPKAAIVATWQKAKVLVPEGFLSEPKRAKRAIAAPQGNARFSRPSKT